MHYEHQYTTLRGFRHAQMMADTYGVTDHAELGNKLMMHGRDVREVATYGDWRILRYHDEHPAFGSNDEAKPAYFTAEGPKGLSLGFTDEQGGLPALLDHLREWDQRELPACTCPASECCGGRATECGGSGTP